MKAQGLFFGAIILWGGTFLLGTEKKLIKSDIKALESKYAFSLLANKEKICKASVAETCDHTLEQLAQQGIDLQKTVLSCDTGSLLYTLHDIAPKGDQQTAPLEGEVLLHMNAKGVLLYKKYSIKSRNARDVFYVYPRNTDPKVDIVREKPTIKHHYMRESTSTESLRALINVAS